MIIPKKIDERIYSEISWNWTWYKKYGKNDENDNSYSRDISNLEEKVISMYGLEMSTRDINKYIQEIYELMFTDKIIPLVEEWQNRLYKRLGNDKETIGNGIWRKTERFVVNSFS